MKIIVKQDQTIYDVALQYAGSLEAVVSILVANGKANTALLIGEELEIPDVLVARVAGFFNDKGWVPATSPKPLDPDGWVPPPGLGGKVNVFMNGTFLDFVNAPSDLNVVVTDENDVVIVPISGNVVGGVATVKIPTALEILIPYKILDGSASIVVVTGSEGTIDIIDSTGLFAFTIAVNSTPVTVPFALAVGDVVDFTFTASTLDGNIKLNGYA